ncbi:MAG: Clp protease ClpP [Methylobacter sp.]|uniref:ClpP-like prohead protease/major capsid protein fusion protein n=1 Tax=Methylobacter sp. TaxID=2051955 RepID=UPI0025D569E1|nr:ClpP-like prohead protease/major capsid protein fusion protein [Methylobacter sp.]MCK9622234.1 Clp protease ClpP [Methylobacter sp.]
MSKYKISAAGQNPNVTELLIYGDIGMDWWAEESNDAKTIVGKLDAINTPDIHVRINSFGGSAVDGIAIHNALKRHGSSITVFIDGVAMSAASLIAMAGDTVIMAANAMIMIHGAQTSTYQGGAKDHRNTADMLDKYSEAMAASYAEKTGKPAEEMLGLLTDGVDHFYTAAEALDAGFIDSIGLETFAIAASAAETIKQRYSHAPTAWLSTLTTHGAQSMTTPVQQQQTVAAVAQPLPIATSETQQPTAAAIEAQRQTDINAIFALVPEARADIHAIKPQLMIDNTITADAARQKILAKLGENSQPVARNAYIEIGMADSDKFRVGASAALGIRAGVEKNDGKNSFRGLTLLELAGHVLAMHGINYQNMGKMERVAAAFTHSSGDFTYVLKNSAEKMLLKGWDEAPETFQSWTVPGVLTDFKIADRVGLNAFPSLLEVPEGGEYQYASIGNRGETIQLATYGRVFSITRQAIINDDLSAFTKIPMTQGRAARRTVGGLVYAVLTSNPTMADGVALFHADHANISGTAATITSASVSAMRTLMAKQTDGGSNAAALNIQLATLLVPVALEDQANTVATSAYRVDGAAESKSTVPNTQKGRFNVVADPRLDAASSQIWYGVANPNMHDTIEVAYLDGNDTPYLEQKNGWDVDGVEFKVRIDAGVKALDHRSFGRNAGA